MPDTSPSIPDAVASTFDSSLSLELIHLYDYASTSSIPLSKLGPQSKGGCQFIHVVPDLASKPAVPLHTPDLSQVTKRDPFEGPEYGKGEKVMDLEASDASPYSVVLNKFALMREHFMAIPHFTSSHPFRPQTSPLVSSDLEIAYKIVSSYASKGIDLVCFFNGGPNAGASQPHLHIQFCPFQHDVPPLMQVVASSLPDNNDDEGKGEEVKKLDLPWIVFCLKLPSSPLSPSKLHTLYERLLETSNEYLSTLPESSLPPPGPKRSSHNFFLTPSHIFLVPRRSRLISIPRSLSLNQGHLSLGGGWEEVEGAEKDLRLSVNGLSVLGYWYVGSKEEEGDLRGYGVERVLRECGYLNEEYEEKK
ncbi:uncharacterized protein JCM6883_003384 [Sporobolomyces salmoneus]|uniref:uncharacterized protein n=1 Tax=Sporobolomyces salmoneus TaxID=183962 RepID=UPI00317C66B5